MSEQGRPWEAGDVAAIVTNPFYAIELHPSLCRPHELELSEADWIAANERAIEELGARRWLELLLLALKRDHTIADPEGQLAIADPYPAIFIEQTLCEPHPPLVDEETWISGNAHQLEADDAGAWLQNLLSVLKGAWLAAP